MECCRPAATMKCGCGIKTDISGGAMGFVLAKRWSFWTGSRAQPSPPSALRSRLLDVTTNLEHRRST